MGLSNEEVIKRLKVKLGQHCKWEAGEPCDHVKFTNKEYRELKKLKDETVNCDCGCGRKILRKKSKLISTDCLNFFIDLKNKDKMSQNNRDILSTRMELLVEDNNSMKKTIERLSKKLSEVNKYPLTFEKFESLIEENNNLKYYKTAYERSKKK